MIGTVLVLGVGALLWWASKKPTSAQPPEMAPLTGVETRYSDPNCAFELEVGTGAYVVKPAAQPIIAAQLAARGVFVESVQSGYTHALLTKKQGSKSALDWVKAQAKAGRVVLFNVSDPLLELLSVPAKDGNAWAVAPGRAIIARPAK